MESQVLQRRAQGVPHAAAYESVVTGVNGDVHEGVNEDVAGRWCGWLGVNGNFCLGYV